MNTAGLLDEFVEALETRLEAILPATSEHSQVLVDGMRYAVLNGGKRLRGSLVCATTYTLSGSYEKALDSACALECLHAYSLVHDDLPVMDDADLRRGKPSCHKKFGPAMATLIGDALQPLAFNLIVECYDVSNEKRVAISRSLSRAAGWQGMVGGQAWDIQLTADTNLEIEQLRRLHAAKTGEFFVAAVEIGRIISDIDEDEVTSAALRRFAVHLGEAFQVVDDVLDCSQSTEVLGKPGGQDKRLEKNTFPVLLGLNGATEYAHDLLNKAHQELRDIGIDESPLGEVANRCVDRIS